MTRSWLLLLAVGLVVLAAGSVIVAPSPADAGVPGNLGRSVDDARTALLDRVDLIEPGSGLVLTRARCRADGGVFFTFTNRWLWAVERSYYASSDGPPTTPASFGGGVLDGSTDDEVRFWLQVADEVDCAAIALPWCEGDGFGVGYPAGWFVHPADPARRIGACTLFAAEPFDAAPAADGGWTGADVTFWLGEGCRGSFDRVVESMEVVVDGFPGHVARVVDGHGIAGPEAYEYVVSLTGSVPCDQSAWLVARTEASAPIGLDAGRAALDRMIGTLRIAGER